MSQAFRMTVGVAGALGRMGQVVIDALDALRSLWLNYGHDMCKSMWYHTKNYGLYQQPFFIVDFAQICQILAI
jgi:dihydrodipicolinate reductase